MTRLTTRLTRQHQALTGTVHASTQSRDISDGACLTCLANGETRFPLDPGHHTWRYGHVPDLADLPKICTALGITVERWDALADRALSERQGEVQ